MMTGFGFLMLPADLTLVIFARMLSSLLELEEVLELDDELDLVGLRLISLVALVERGTVGGEWSLGG